MVKKILIVVIGLIVVLLLVGFVFPRQFETSRSLTINTPADYIFDEVNDLERNEKWSYWNSIYDDMTTTYGDIKVGEGAVMEWDGPESGKGKMTITESVPYSSIKTDLDFMEDGTAEGWYTFEPDGEGTKVTTGFSFDLGMNPLARWMGVLMIKPEMNKSFEYNLAKLKEIAEAKPRYTVPISIEGTSAISYIGISSTMAIDDQDGMAAQMGKSYGELMSYLQKNNVQIAGAPFCLYPKWDEANNQMEMVCALPVPSDADFAKGKVNYPVMQLPAGVAVKATHTGNYDKLGETHGQIDQYIAMKGLTVNGPPMELYITDPMEESDTTKWITEIYYPVKQQ
jgi:effector-binding domain-containing protein